MTRFLFLPLCGALLLNGCASKTPAPTAAESEPPAATRAAPSYDSETLSDLLVAEVAAQRQSLGVTLAYYSQAARNTGDPQVISQAAQLAHYLEDHQQALALSELWLEQEPAEEEALQLAILSEIRLGNIDAASRYLDTLLGEHGGEALGRLVGQARGLDAQGNRQLVQALAQLSDRYPDQAPLWYARALWLEQEGDYAGALEADERALDLMPRHEDALLLKAQLLHKLGEEKKALRHLKKLVRKYPDARRPRITYIRMLLATGATGNAEKQLSILAEQHPQDLDLRFSLALLALEAGATNSARQELQALLSENYRPDDMHLYLGQAAEQAQDLNEAVDHYLKVQGGQAVRANVQAARLLYQLNNQDQASALMASLAGKHPELSTSLTITEAEMRSNTGNPQGALALLDRAVKAEPDNTELLYSRAMVAESIGDLTKMESDLRHVLSINPDDASALNALGYTLANRTQRLDEAFDYISRALELRPDDPAILDSMGWVLYKRGEPEAAREYLRRAYEKFPDPEVAAHYGEVLWVLGAQNQARQVWRDTLESNPDAPHIREVMEKLGARL
ncbi:MULTISPECIES: tetratricopeptide repeat protein [Alcanivorax]|uniref:tetratricopeptide repeat protein n=1 Tax=Alcanivorax TaxID=59753 RepID=UPI0025C3D4B9|nr:MULTISPECIES: tetratricopeptide repeat protein [Alcanivorax]